MNKIKYVFCTISHEKSHFSPSLESMCTNDMVKFNLKTIILEMLCTKEPNIVFNLFVTQVFKFIKYYSPDGEITWYYSVTWLHVYMYIKQSHK